MDKQSIVRRIMQIKKVSVELKQSTQDPFLNNTQLLKGILKANMSIDNSEDKQSQQYNNKTQRSHFDASRNLKYDQFNLASPKMRKGETYPAYQSNATVSANEQYYSTQREEQLNSIAIPSHQIKHWRNQNSELEEEIRNLQEKLKRLEQIEKQQIDEQWKDGLPYFVLHMPKAHAFFTKLTIEERDYDKIDYKFYSIDLTLQKIILKPTPINSLDKPQKSVTLMLSDLKEVSYFIPQQKNNLNTIPFNLNYRIEEEEQFLVVYYFKHTKYNPQTKSKSKKASRKSSFYRGDERSKDKEQDEILQTLFLKFDNQQQYKQWDLGVFINYKIMQDLSKNDTKAVNKSLKNSGAYLGDQSPQYNKQNDVNNNYMFKNLLQKYSYKNRENGDQKQGIYADIIDYDSHDRNHDEIKADNYSSIEEYLNQDSFSQTKPQKNIQKLHSNIQKIQDRTIIPISNQKKESNNIKIRDEIESPVKQFKQSKAPQRNSGEEIINKKRSDTSHFGPLTPVINAEEKAKLIQKQLKLEEENKRNKQKQLEQQLRKQEERMVAMKKMQYELSVKKAKERLKQGYLLTKYAKRAIDPYQKKVYVSEDGKRLCWLDIKKPGEEKWILIKDIIGIRQGEIGQGIQEHEKQIKNKACFVTIHIISKDRKNLEFGSKDQNTMEQFCKDFQLYKQVSN